MHNGLSDNYFYVHRTLNTETRLREKPKFITLYWDASLSMQSRDLDKELDFLSQYFSYLKNVKVNLIKFSNAILLNKKYTVTNGHWKKLKSELVNTIYDGGTSYVNLFRENDSDETLLFSDGMKNMSDIVIKTTKPIFIINSLVKANHSELNDIGESTTGKYINLKNSSVMESIENMKFQSLKFLGFDTSNKNTEAYPNTPIMVSEGFSFTGKNFKKNDSITLNFGYGNDVTEKTCFVVKSDVSNVLVKRIWAQKKLRLLQKESELNKDEIINHSKAYNLVSNHTSLIVLETVRDYVKYKIAPPEELLEEYNRIINRNSKKKAVITQDNIGENKEAEIQRTTNLNGNYSINAIPGSILVFSYLGFQTLESTISESNIVNIKMQEDFAALDEIVVVGFGTQKKRAVVGSITQVKSEDISSHGYTRVADALQGRVSGLQVRNNSGLSGSSPSIIIRGNSSFYNNDQPLFVVDGMPVTGNVDDFINVNDIESINVIKDVSSAAIYGSRASNGVIVITSKLRGNNQNRNYRNINKKQKKHKYKGSLKVKRIVVNEPYIAALKMSKSLEEAYEKYLIQRKEYGHLPTYYIDVYDYFKKWNNRNYELRILTNVAELDFDNYELLRVLGYKLEEGNNYGLASFIYQKVLKLRPEDSQSYRDLALVYQEIGLEQEAFNLLNSIVSENIYKNTNRRKFIGMQNISKNEINKLLQNNSNIKKKGFSESFEVNTTYDVRILIDWNHNDTDIDLHVIDPNLEECYFEHSKTAIGGKLSQDMTQGFGPEEFTLKYAKKGAYFIKVNYYGDRYQKIKTPTTFMKITMFKNFGKPNETKEIKIIRLTKPRDKQIVAKLEV